MTLGIVIDYDHAYRHCKLLRDGLVEATKSWGGVLGEGSDKCPAAR